MTVLGYQIPSALPQAGPALSWPRPVPWGGVLPRLRASTAARRLVPTELALLGVDVVYRLALRMSASRMAAAVASMDAIVGGTPAQDELVRLARSHVAAQARSWELTWRWWELERVPIVGRARIDQARATGRGLMISHAHLGPLGCWVPLAQLLRPLYHPAGDWVIQPPRPGYNGYQSERRRKIFRDAGIAILHAKGSAMILYKILTYGGAVLMSMDVPGRRRTQFLGKPVDIVDGTARLAVKADALVLPAALMPAGRRWEIQIGEVLDPRDFSSPDELHVQLAALHEDLIMRAPDHLEDPKRLWARASREGWYEQ